MEASGVPVCWVTDHERPWIGEVPAIRIALPAEPAPSAATDAKVVDGTRVFLEPWCPLRRSANDDGTPGPCPAPGWWRPVVPPADPRACDGGVLTGKISAHTPTAPTTH